MTAKFSKKVLLKNLNPLITCNICKGYLIDALANTECKHTFCKSCLVKHLENNNSCPTCKTVIHQSYPLNYVSHDRQLQNIVFALLPHLQENEIEREKKFLARRGLPYPKEKELDEKESSSVLPYTAASLVMPHPGCQIGVKLCAVPDKQLEDLEYSFLRCSSQTTITALMRYISCQLLNTYDRYREIEILYDGNLLGKDHCLKFIYISYFKNKRDNTLVLNYQLSNNT